MYFPKPLNNYFMCVLACGFVGLSACITRFAAVVVAYFWLIPIAKFIVLSFLVISASSTVGPGS